MKKEKRFLNLVFFSSLSLIIICTVAVANSASSVSLSRATNDVSYTLNLSEENKPTLAGGNGSINVYGENVEYVNAKEYSDGHVSLNQDGYIYKNHTLGLKAINVDFDGDPNSLLLKTGDSSSNYNFEYYLQDNVNTAVEGNAFKLCALKNVNISSIKLVYKCSESTTHTHNADKSTWYENDTSHYHICLNENCISHLDENLHNVVTNPEVAPTTSSVGYTSYKKCSVCDHIVEEAKTIPLLSSAAYNISYKTTGSGRNYSEVTTYTLKDTSVLGEKVYTTSVATSAFVLVNGTAYTPETFKRAFAGVEMFLTDNTITLNVTNENGATINGNISALKNLRITGYPLTINTNNTSDAIKLNVYSNTISDLYVENVTNVIGSGAGTASGFVCKNITVNQGGKLSISGYTRSTWLCGGTIAIYGDIDFTASSSAFSGDAGSTLSTSRWVFKNGTEVASVTLGNAGTHLEVVGFDDTNHEHSNITYSVATSPTKEAAGALEGKCSLGHVTETVEIPKLSTVDYTANYTSKIVTGDKVQDIERYTWNETKYGTFYFDINGTTYDEYIKAGTSVYSVNRWNELFPNQTASVNNKVLTITLKGDTTVTAVDGKSALDGTLDLTKFTSVVINGNGKLNVNYTVSKDGLTAKALTIGENAKVYLSGYNRVGSGFKVESALTVDGLLDITGFNGSQYVDGDKVVVDTVNEGGKINIHECNIGLHGWNTGKLTVHNSGEFDFDTLTNVHTNTLQINYYTHTTGVTNINNITGESALTLNGNTNWYFDGVTNIENVTGYGIYVNAAKTLNINGELNLKTITNHAFNVLSNLVMNVNETGSVSVDGVTQQGFDVSGTLKLYVKGSFKMKNLAKNGFWLRTLYNINLFEVTGNGVFDITTNNYGIYHGGESTTSWSDGKKTYDVNVRDQATFNIYSKVNTLYGFNNFIVAQSDHSKCNASVTLHNKTGDSVQNAKLNNDTYFVLNSSKEMFVYTDSNEHSGTAFNFVSASGYDSAGTMVYKIYTNMTIRNFYCAVGGSTRKWGSASLYIPYTMLVENCSIKTANWNSVVPCCTSDPVNLIGLFRDSVKYDSDSWTVLLYLCGNDLETDHGRGTEDLDEICFVSGQPSDTNVVVQAGGAKAWEATYGNSLIKADKCNRFHLRNKQFVLDTQTDQVNMGKQESLADFMTWGLANYPAQNVALVLWDHGDGIDGCCFDENYGSSDGLTSDEIAGAIATAYSRTGYSNKLEFLGIDCCMQQIQDCVGIYYPYTKYVVASEENEWGKGWTYNEWLDDVYAKKPTEIICQEIVDKTFEELDWYYSVHKYTLSYVDLTNWKAYENAWEDFAAYLKNSVILTSGDWSTLTSIVKSSQGYGPLSDNNYHKYDLYDSMDFMSKLKASSFNSNATLMEKVSSIETAFAGLNVYSKAGSNSPGTHGLAFYCPVYNKCYYKQERTSFKTWWLLCKKFVTNCD